jgi:hypothetical protein
MRQVPGRDCVANPPGDSTGGVEREQP